MFVITDVHFIPLSSQTEAQNSIDEVRKSRARKRASKTSGTDTDDETDASVSGTDDEHYTDPATPAVDHPGAAGAQKGLGALAKGTSVAADVIVDKGKYGRFAERWFSKAGWSANGRAKQGMSSTSEEDLTREQKRQGLKSLPEEESQSTDAAPKELQAAVEETRDKPAALQESISRAQAAAQGRAADSIVDTLAPRILRALRIFLSSHSFFYSYEYDLSRRLATHERSSSNVPLYKRFDPRVSQ